MGQIILLLISYIPDTIQRIYLVVTRHTEETWLRSILENSSGDVTSFFTTFQSSLSFVIYLITGGQLFRQSLKPVLPRVLSISYDANKHRHASAAWKLRRLNIREPT